MLMMPRSVIGSGFSVAPLNFGGGISLNTILAKAGSGGNRFAAQTAEKDRQLTEPVFAEHPITSHDEPRIAEILDGIRAHNLPLKLYAGEAGFKDPQPSDEKQKIWKLANGEGMEFQFVIDCDSGKPLIHAIWLKVEVEKQGSFFAVRRFFEQVAALLLEHCGYPYLYGRAVWSSNSRIKALPNKPDIEQDWRWLPVFCGWDASLKPIVHEGLVALYLKMGFILHPKHGDENYVVFSSDAYTQRFIAEHGQAKWNEMTQLSFARRREWLAIQKQRAAQVSQPKEKIRAALEYERNKLKRNEQELERLWTQIRTRNANLPKLY
jgi:hypothetical protein